MCRIIAKIDKAYESLMKSIESRATSRAVILVMHTLDALCSIVILPFVLIITIFLDSGS